MKKILPDTIAIVSFIIIALAYFFYPTINNQVLLEHDTAAGIGAGQEAKTYYEEHGERTRWTNALFSGMPTYQISPSYKSTDTLKVVEKTYSLGLPKYTALVFIMLFGFYILLRSFNISPLIAGIGAVLWAFSSYFFILIAAGHLWKFITLAYIPPTIAGINWAYKKKYILGGIVAALFASLQIMSNHVQMTYYFLFVILFIVGAYFVESYKKNDLKSFWKSTIILTISGLLAISINSSTLYHTYQYSKHSNRASSELSSTDNNNSDVAKKAYITQWSYGIDETLTLLIPNYKGGASKPIAANQDLINKVPTQYPQVFNYFTQYFGTQPFTAGPVYVGAFVLFLFFIGCFFVKSPLKWALVGATVFSILLAWGKNFMPLTDLFIDYIPLYDKFRAVSSILVIAEFTIPLLAILGLVELINNKLKQPKLSSNDLKYIVISFILTGGIALILALFPSIAGPFTSTNDINVLNQLPQELAPATHSSIVTIREYIVQKDAIRSLIIIVLGVSILSLYYLKRINSKIAIIFIGILCFIDLWQVDKRYLHDSLFSDKKTVLFQKTEVDNYILADKDPNYRVLNLTTDTFNENNTSYWHKSIGGYNAAKIGRYQELIEHGIYKDISALADDIKKQNLNLDKLPILNMLNTKYIILGNKIETVLLNNKAYGNGWFVSQIIKPKNPDEELNLLHNINLKNTATVYNQNINIKNNNAVKGDIELVSYQPNRLEYQCTNDQEAFAVFSEIYYPGWTATIDNVATDIYRANYVLRGIIIPKGKHTVVFEFKPKSIQYTEILAYIAMFALLLIIITYTYKAFYKKK